MGGLKIVPLTVSGEQGGKFFLSEKRVEAVCKPGILKQKENRGVTIKTPMQKCKKCMGGAQAALPGIKGYALKKRFAG